MTNDIKNVIGQSAVHRTLQLVYNLANYLTYVIMYHGSIICHEIDLHCKEYNTASLYVI